MKKILSILMICMLVTSSVYAMGCIHMSKKTEKNRYDEINIYKDILGQPEIQHLYEKTRQFYKGL